MYIGEMVDFLSRVWVAGFGMEAVFLLGVAFSQSTTVALTCLTLAVGMSGFAISGKILRSSQTSAIVQYGRSNINLSTKYTSTLFGSMAGVGSSERPYIDWKQELDALKQRDH